MSNLPLPVVVPGAYLTLHYRLATEDGTDIVTTFNDSPATLQLGQGQLAAPLEACLIGLAEGVTHTFELKPDAAFGQRNPELLQRVSRGMLAENTQAGQQYEIGDLVEFTAPSGGRFAGMLREIDEDGALFDFNHPLAGRRVQFTVQIIGIL